jgi:hypothetical protein
MHEFVSPSMVDALDSFELHWGVYDVLYYFRGLSTKLRLLLDAKAPEIGSGLPWPAERRRFIIIHRVRRPRKHRLPVRCVDLKIDSVNL